MNDILHFNSNDYIGYVFDKLARGTMYRKNKTYLVAWKFLNLPVHCSEMLSG